MVGKNKRTFSESSILIIDGQGENVSTTFAIGSGKSIKILWSLPVEYSLGYFYEAVSDFIGFRLNEAGKTMGLAPYGNSVKYNLPQIKITNNGFDIDLEIEKNNSSFDQQQAIISAWQNSFKKILGCSKNRIDFVFRNIYGDITKSISLNQEYKNFAASAQFTLESILQHCVKVLIKKTSIRNLCLAGGVALNCSANTKIKNINGIDKLFIPPFANDAGVSVGAALYVGGKREKKQFESAFVGPTFTNKEIELILKKLKINYQKFKNIEEVTARLIHRGKIVSWFQGQMEVGPRALGNRSILANPTLLDMHKKVNEAKNRELWRPLAPSILDEKGESYMNGYFYSPFMLHTFQVKDSVKRKVPAIVHIDGSTRPQSVRKNINPGFYKLIKFYEKLSGIPLILNPSFNGAKEPIVCTPLDAISSFYTNSTDYLVLSNYLIKK
ncbi:MAG: Carbamoyl transferase [Candidatus Woesebacteria bacterium GW2011_GWA1_38_8]|uniref:Carbamoyl transferase n=1 Tax=Candidatus Woesebacteria bacterium GW2011_GWA1_38_8 TaxID=1618547 RepID=A0A0G0L934_9BACT|nr:MAG: Carbamoyl transferase [Candidatus Woesebacteria bacterium GW2011_GWA1_38_8]